MTAVQEPVETVQALAVQEALEKRAQAAQAMTRRQEAPEMVRKIPVLRRS